MPYVLIALNEAYKLSQKLADFIRWRKNYLM